MYLSFSIFVVKHFVISLNVMFTYFSTGFIFSDPEDSQCFILSMMMP